MTSAQRGSQRARRGGRRVDARRRRSPTSDALAERARRVRARRSRTARPSRTSRRSPEAPDASSSISAPTIASTTRGSTASPSACARAPRRDGASRTRAATRPRCSSRSRRSLPLARRPGERLRRERLQRRGHDAFAEERSRGAARQPHAVLARRPRARARGRAAARRRVFFVPHVAPFFRGITVTVSVALARAERARGSGARYVEALRRGAARARCRTSRRSCATSPGKHDVAIGGLTRRRGRPPRASSSRRSTTCSAGAATQALQNLNLALGCPSSRGSPR